MGGAKARVVAYDLSWQLLERDGETITGRVWIDPKLDDKRFEVPRGGG